MRREIDKAADDSKKRLDFLVDHFLDSSFPTPQEKNIKKHQFEINCLMQHTVNLLQKAGYSAYPDWSKFQAPADDFMGDSSTAYLRISW